MAYDKIKVPANGEKITMGADGKLNVPDHPIITYIEGDGTESDEERGGIYDIAELFAGKLEKLGATHRFDHRPGTHNWDFWDQSLKDCFAYLFA